MEKKVLVIVGPTASGKSALAVKLAKKFDGEVISADSRQVYKGLDVGTGKITKQEMQGIPHHLLDVVNPRVQFSVSDYKKLAENSLRYIVQKDMLPIVVGGTGFYIDVLTGAIVLPDVPANKILRKTLEKKSAGKLFKILKKKDKKRAEAIGQYNKVRLIRALEIIAALGRVPTHKSVRSTYEFIYIGLKSNDLDTRIHERLVKRLHGFVCESKKLLKLKKLSYERMYQLGLEYRYTAMYLQKKITLDEMASKLFIEIRRYAKRQITWFKRNKKIKWFRPENLREIDKYVRMALLGLP